MTWLSSLGIKRYLASIIEAVLPIVRSIPGLEAYVSILEQVAGIVGATGVAHATVSKNKKSLKLASITSTLSALIAVAAYIPALTPYVAALKLLTSVLGAIAVGKGIK